MSKKTMNALIIDDESKARTLLRTILEEYCSDVHEVREADSLLKGVNYIKEEQPDIVFLDVEMPEHMGTQIMDFFR